MHFHQQSDHCGITTGTSDHAGISAQFALLLYCLIKGKPATLALRMPAMDRTCTYNIKVENEEICCHFRKVTFYTISGNSEVSESLTYTPILLNLQPKV